MYCGNCDHDPCVCTIDDLPIPVESSLCDICMNAMDEAYLGRIPCRFFGFSQKPRKKKCKGFKTLE